MTETFRQELVSSANVMVVGCGALGNEVLKNLVLMGVRHLVIVDFDRIETDNLTRSIFFTLDDARDNRKKTEVIAERLKSMNKETEVQSICGDIAYDVGLGLFRKMDVVIGCVDNRWARYCINRLCMRAGKPWVDGAIDRTEGTARVFKPNMNCYACNLGPEGLRDLTFRMPCAGTVKRDVEAGKVPTTSIAASVIGAVEVQEALKIICNSGDSLCGKMFYYEGMNLTTKIAGFKAYDEDCPVHEKWEPVVNAIITNSNTVSEVLDALDKVFETNGCSLCLINDSFVDWITRRDKDERISVMCPGHQVATHIEKVNDIKGIPLSEFYQHEYRQIDREFPYQGLTLKELGIPEEDVFYVNTCNGVRYVELSKM